MKCVKGTRQKHIESIVCMFHTNEGFRYSSVFAFATLQLAIDILFRKQVDRIWNKKTSVRILPRENLFLALTFFLYFICFWVLTVFTNVQKQSYKFYVHKIYLTQTYYTNKNTLYYTTGQKNRSKKKKEASLNCNE